MQRADRKKFREEDDHPTHFLEEDLENDAYSLEEYGFQLGYYQEE